MFSTSNLADRIGRKTLSDALGVGLTAVSNAVVRGTFPASWYLAVSALAKREGVDCPPALFGMKDIPQDVDASSEVQAPSSERAA